MANILIYALHYEGAINKNSLGAVSEGARLAGELGGEAHAILVGEGVPQELAASLGAYGATKVLVAERPILGDSAISEIKYRSPVGIVIGRLNAFEARESGGGEAAVEQLAFELSP